MIFLFFLAVWAFWELVPPEVLLGKKEPVLSPPQGNAVLKVEFSLGK